MTKFITVQCKTRDSRDNQVEILSIDLNTITSYGTSAYWGGQTYIKTNDNEYVTVLSYDELSKLIEDARNDNTKAYYRFRNGISEMYVERDKVTGYIVNNKTQNVILVLQGERWETNIKRNELKDSIVYLNI